jgi:hypothetical protein
VNRRKMTANPLEGLSLLSVKRYWFSSSMSAMVVELRRHVEGLNEKQTATPETALLHVAWRRTRMRAAAAAPWR